MRKRCHPWFLLPWCSFMLSVSSQCPWSRELVDLHTDCVCAYSNSQRISIQCSPVNFTRLMSTLRASVSNIPIDLLYVSNATIEILRNGSFEDLKIQSLHLSKSKIREVEDGAFSGLEDSLTSLSLQDNLLRKIPKEAIKELGSLQLLDLSHNVMRRVGDESFKGLPLSTLKLSDNSLNISDFAFRGLEGSLKSLNLQSSDLKVLPKAIRRLKFLALLDLAQNKIEALEPDFFSDMQSLTAINLERNRIKEIDDKAFSGVNSTLSSLSLLNNHLKKYPIEAISMLTEIRVLDLGFNGITVLPHDAFRRNKYLTLLALDGNPLNTLPIEAFLHLNTTLRGLSLGGSSLECDCRIRWIAEWIRDRGLQVTSRERNPQFCGNPEHLRKHTFLQLQLTDFYCVNETLRPRQATKRPKRLNVEFDERTNDVAEDGDKLVQIVTVDAQVDIAGAAKDMKINSSALGSIAHSGTVKKKSNKQQIRIKQAYKRDSKLVIEWDSEKESSRGHQVLIRMFGSQEFKKIIPIPSDHHKLQVEQLPLHQCIIVCVIEYEEASNIQIENIPAKQCRELKGDDSRILSLDKVVIAASAIICIVVIIGALIVILLYFRRWDGLRSSSLTPIHPHHHTNTLTAVLPPLVKQHIPPETDWETLSWNSGRSSLKTNGRNCLMGKSGSTSHSFVIKDGQFQVNKTIMNGFSKSYSARDNDSRLSYSHISKISPNNFNIQRSKSLTRPGTHQMCTGGYIRKKKHRQNGRLASASSSTECDSDWNGRSIWKDNDVDIYISQNHMMSGNHKYRKDYSVR